VKQLIVSALLIAGGLTAHAAQSSTQQKFISGGTIRMHLSAGGYTIRPTDSANIVVTCHTNFEDQLNDIKVEITPGPSSADLYIRHTPHNNFHATIEVPRQSNLWVRLSAGELVVEEIEGDKNLEITAGRLEVAVPHPELYSHRDASVFTGSIDASAFSVSKGGMFRSFEQDGTGKYRLHAHVMTGEIDLHGAD